MSDEFELTERKMLSWIVTDEQHWLHFTLENEKKNHLEYEVKFNNVHLGIDIR